MAPSAMHSGIRLIAGLAALFNFRNAEALAVGRQEYSSESLSTRQRVRLDVGWRFRREETNPDGLIYDVGRTDVPDGLQALKPWILPTANEFINDPAKHYERPAEEPAGNVTFAQGNFDDSDWDVVRVPHDWAIGGPFYVGEDDDVPVGGGMGRLPIQGVGWYRQKLEVTAADKGKRIYLDIDGAMSYAIVWVNGHLVGGWLYGYNSFRLDITEYLTPGDDNQLAIRLDNPLESSRWYPGAGLYRNVWLTKVESIHVAQWGTYITTEVSAESATVDLEVQVVNKGENDQDVKVVTDVHTLDGIKVASFPSKEVKLQPGRQSVSSSTTVEKPQLWGPPPTQQPNLYVAVTHLYVDGQEIDTYETRFGIRSISYEPDGLVVNGEHVKIRGVNQHHDLGALGAAFNMRAAQRQLAVLRDLGVNAVRMSHNPPASELLDLADQLGFLVMDEIFDSWERNKTDNDFHLIFPDWAEADLRSFARRDRNHPSIIAWSVGNEVGEQQTGDSGAAIVRRLHEIIHEEDPTRQATASMNWAKPNMSFPRELDFISLNYQGEGIRDTSPYVHLNGTRTPPLYDAFHEAFPKKMLLSTETAAALSSRGTYIFPVTAERSAPVNDTSGGNSTTSRVSAYELYTAGFGSSLDKVFAAQDAHPFVAGEFVWSGWDYLGEAEPYYDTARSSYFGIIDLAGFPKDRYHAYRARWRPDLPAVHVLPHWTWPERVGLVTPVHAFAAADEAELFLNGRSQGRLSKDPEHVYRFRWDDVVYEPGEIRVVAYRDGEVWATDSARTVGEPAGLRLRIDDRTTDPGPLKADGEDLAFVIVEVVDDRGDVVPRTGITVAFSITSGAGELVATDNGDPADMTSFPSKERKTFSGRALAIIREPGTIVVEATTEGLPAAKLSLIAH